MYIAYAQSLEKMSFRRGKEDRFDQICELVYKYCKDAAPVETGLLKSSITKRKYKNKVIIAVKKGEAREYAKFVEYGTGVRGQNSPHPFPPQDWVYNAHFLKTGVDWKGMVPRAYMYRTYLYAQSLLSMRTRNQKWYRVTYGYSGTRDNPAVIIERIM